MTVTNPGTGPINNVALKASFDPGLEHESKASAVMRNLGTLGPLESRVTQLTLMLRLAGRHITGVTATADGGLSDSADQALLVQQPDLGVELIGPEVAAHRPAGGVERPRHQPRRRAAAERDPARPPAAGIDFRQCHPGRAP